MLHGPLASAKLAYMVPDLLAAQILSSLANSLFARLYINWILTLVREPEKKERKKRLFLSWIVSNIHTIYSETLHTMGAAQLRIQYSKSKERLRVKGNFSSWWKTTVGNCTHNMELIRITGFTCTNEFVFIPSASKLIYKVKIPPPIRSV